MSIQNLQERSSPGHFFWIIYRNIYGLFQNNRKIDDWQHLSSQYNYLSMHVDHYTETLRKKILCKPAAA